MKEIKEMQEGDEEEKAMISMSEEQLAALLDEMEAQEFLTMEDADAWFEKKEEEIREIRVKMYHKTQRNRPEPTEHDKFFESAKPQIESEVDDAWVLDQENFNEFLRYKEKEIGRYPHGWRHYENYANYSVANPEAPIQEYMEEMNRPVTFEEFARIMRQHALETHDSPEHYFENRLEDGDATLMEFANSP